MPLLSALLLLFLLASSSQAFDVLELDDSSVVLFGGAFNSIDGSETILRTSSLGESREFHADPLLPWFIDEECDTEVEYEWRLIRGGRHVDDCLPLRKKHVKIPLGLLGITGTDLPQALIYYIGEASCGEYMEFCREKHYPTPPEKHFKNMHNYLLFFLDYPVLNVNYLDAISFCAWKNAELGLNHPYDSDGTLIPGRTGFRLPTVVECLWLSELQTHDPNWAGMDGFEFPASLNRSAEERVQHIRGNLWEWTQNGIGGASSADRLQFGERIYFAPDGMGSRMIFGGGFKSNPEDMQNLISVQNSSSRLEQVGFRPVRWLDLGRRVEYDQIVASSMWSKAAKESKK